MLPSNQQELQSQHLNIFLLSAEGTGDTEGAKLTLAF